MAKRKKPLTCPACKRKFTHSGKSHPMKRLSKHLWKDHRAYMLKKQKSGKRKKKPTQIQTEMEVADDLLLMAIMEIGERLDSLEGKPIQHRNAMGMLIEHVGSLAKRNIAGEKPKKPLQQALFGSLYSGGWEKRKKK